MATIEASLLDICLDGSQTFDFKNLMDTKNDSTPKGDDDCLVLQIARLLWMRSQVFNFVFQENVANTAAM